MRFSALAISLFLVGLSAFGQGSPRRVDGLTNMLALDPRSISTAGKATVETSWRDTAGDGGGGIFDWYSGATDTTNRGTIFASVGAPGRWKMRNWNGDVRVFGVKSYQADYGATPWMKRVDGPTVGTNDFSIWMRFTAPVAAIQSAGVLSLNRSIAADGGLDPLNASLEIYRGSGNEWSILFRGTNSSSASGTTIVEAAKLQAPASLIDVFAGSVVDLVVTRSGTNVAVYLNGTPVTAAFTVTNPAGLAKSLGSGVSLDVNIGTTIANEWIFPTPITRVAMWSTALTAGQALSPATVGGKTVDHNPGSFSVPEDQSTLINDAIDYRSLTGGGPVILPVGHMRIGQINLKPDVRVVGQGAPAYPNNGNRPSRMGATVLVPWYGQSGNVIYFGREYADEQPFLTKRGLVQTGNGVVSSKFIRAGVEHLMIDGSMAWSARGIYLDRVGAVKVIDVGMWHLPGNSVYGVANNGFHLRDSWSQTWRGVHLRGSSDTWVRDFWLDGAKGPGLWLYGNGVQVLGGAFEFSTNPRTAMVLEQAATFDASTETITITDHRHQTGDVVRFLNEGGSLPGGLSASADYFVIRTGNSSIKVSLKYTDEETSGGALNGADVVDITSAGTGTTYVTVGPSVGALVAGDGNTIVDGRYRGNWEDGIRVEGFGENTIAHNNVNLNGYGNPARTNGSIGAIRLIDSDKNKITDNKTDDRENVLGTQFGIVADSNSTENFLSGNSFDILYPYQLAGTGNFWMDGSGFFAPYDGGTPRVYLPSASTFAMLDPLDRTNTTSFLLARDRMRAFWSADYSSTNWWYAPLLPSQTTQWAWQGTGAGAFNIVNNGTGAAHRNVSGTYASSQDNMQVNSSAAGEGYRTSTVKNGGTNSSTYAAAPANSQIRQDYVGWYWGTGSGDAHLAAGSTEWRGVGTPSSGHGQVLWRINLAPTNSATGIPGIEGQMPLATPDTALGIHTAESGSVQKVRRDPTTGVLYTGTLALSGGGGITNLTVNATNVTGFTNSLDVVWSIASGIASPQLSEDVTTTTLRVQDLVLTNAMTVPVGGTGRSNLTANAYLAGNGTNAVSLVGPTAGALAGWNGSGTAAAVTTGVGVTNSGGILSGNYSPGSNVTFTTNANGNVSIAASGGGGATNGTAVSVDGVYAPAVNLADGSEITVTLSSTNVTAAIANDAVDYGQMQNVSAASRVLGRGSASGSGDVQELTLGSGLWLNGTVLGITNNFPTDWYAGGFLPLYAGVSNALTGDLHFKQGSDIRVPMWESGSEWEAVGMRAANGIWSVVQYNTNDFTVLETMLEVDPSLKSSGTNAVTVRNSGFNNFLLVEPNARFDGDVEFGGNIDLGASAAATTAAANSSNAAVATTAYVDRAIATHKGYTLQISTGAGGGISSGTTYYGGPYPAQDLSASSSYDLVKMAIPATGTLKRVDYVARVGGTLGSGESVTNSIRINGTTDVATTTFAYSATSSRGSATGLSVAVTEGDYAAFKLACPTWSTTPTSVRWAITLYIE